MKKLPTAEEMLKSNYLLIENDKTCEAHTHLVVKQMQEYAKLHVQAALESAAEKVKTKKEDWCDKDENFMCVDKQSILNAYPLDNIQ